MNKRMALLNFIHGNFNLNVVLENNEPLFYGKEVATILGYKDTKDAVQRHVDLEDKIEFKDLQGGGPAPSLINTNRIES